MDPLKIIYYILLITTLVVFRLNRAKLNGSSLYFLEYLLALSIVTEILVDCIHHYTTTTSWIIFHVYQPIEYILIAFIFHKSIKSKKIKNYILLSIRIYLTILCFYYALDPRSLFVQKYVDFVLESFFVSIWAALYMLELINSDELTEPIILVPLFWVSFAIIIFYSGSIFIMGFRYYLDMTAPSLGRIARSVGALSKSGILYASYFCIFMDTFHEEAVFGLVLGTSLLLFFAFIFVFAIFQSQKKQHKNRLEKNQMQKHFEENILYAQIEVQNETLHNVGQDLHDNLGQLLTVARISLNMITDYEDCSDEVKVKLYQILEAVDQSIVEVRSLTKSLDGNFVKNFGLLDSLKNEMDRIRKMGRYTLNFAIEGQPYSFSFKTEIILFRALQEILNNILKHSRANLINVSLNFNIRSLEIIVKDDGIGFDYQKAMDRNLAESGAGLKNIVERIGLIGGSVQIDTAANQGTTTKIVILNNLVELGY